MKTYIPTVRAENAVAAKYKPRAIQFFNQVSASRQENGLPSLQRYTAVAEGVVICAFCSDYANRVYLWGGEAAIRGLVWRDDLTRIYALSSSGKISRNKIPNPDVGYGDRWWVAPDKLGTISIIGPAVPPAGYNYGSGILEVSVGTEALIGASYANGVYINGLKIVDSTGKLDNALDARIIRLSATGDPPEYELWAISFLGVMAFSYDPGTRIAVYDRLITAVPPLQSLPSADAFLLTAEFNSTGLEFLLTIVRAPITTGVLPIFPNTTEVFHGIIEDGELLSLTRISLWSSARAFSFVNDVPTCVVEYVSGDTSELILEQTFSMPSEGGWSAANYCYVSSIQDRKFVVDQLLVDGQVEHEAPEINYSQFTVMQRDAFGGVSLYGTFRVDTLLTRDVAFIFSVGRDSAGAPFVGKIIYSLEDSTPGNSVPAANTWFNPSSLVGDDPYAELGPYRCTHAAIYYAGLLVGEYDCDYQLYRFGKQGTTSEYYNNMPVVGFNFAMMFFLRFTLRSDFARKDSNYVLRVPLNFFGQGSSDLVDTTRRSSWEASWTALGSPMIMLVNGVDILTERPPQPAVLSYVKAYKRANDLTGEVTEDIIAEALNGMKFGYIGVV